MTGKPSHENNFNLIRLIAALQVLVVHAVNHFEYEGRYTAALKVVPGVPAFFFISGFLIYLSYERMRSQGTASFFVNRALRIYPALIVCVALSVFTVYLTGYFAGRDIGIARFAGWIAGQTTIFQFYNPAFMRGYGVGVLNGALWTISVELQFYLLVPLLYYLMKARPKVAAALFVLSLATNLYVRQSLNWELMYMKLLYVSFLPWFYMFMLGAFVAALPAVRQQLERVPLWLLIAGYVLSMNVVGSYTTNASNSINPLSFALLGLVIVKLAGSRLPLPTRFTRFMRRTDFSYGLYLYHMPVINLLLVLGVLSTLGNIFTALAVSLLLALLSWYVIERPALSHKR